MSEHDELVEDALEGALGAEDALEGVRGANTPDGEGQGEGAVDEDAVEESILYDTSIISSHTPRFFVQATSSREYEILNAGSGDPSGELLAVAEKQRQPFKDFFNEMGLWQAVSAYTWQGGGREVVVKFFGDRDKSHLLFSFESRVGRQARYSPTDVVDVHDTVIGRFAKAHTIGRSKWDLRYRDLVGGNVRNADDEIAARGVRQFLVAGDPKMYLYYLYSFLISVIRAKHTEKPYDFDFSDTTTGKRVMTVHHRYARRRDRYEAVVQDPRMCFAVSAALTLALDILERR